MLMWDLRNPPARLRIVLLSVILTVAGPVPTGRDESDGSKPLRLVFLPGKTRIGTSLSPGWSELIFKSIPYFETGDLDSIPEVAVATASRFRTVMLADIDGKDDNTSSIRRIGLGLVATVDGTDMVLTPSNAAEPPFSFGLVDRQVLSRAQRQLERISLVAATPTMAVLAAPYIHQRGSSYEEVIIVYVITISAGTNRIETDLWLLLSNSEARVPPPNFIQLPPSLEYRCGLDVRATRLLGRLPVKWSFALKRLPPGRECPVPESLLIWSVDLERIRSQPLKFEKIFRHATGRP